MKYFMDDMIEYHDKLESGTMFIVDGRQAEYLSSMCIWIDEYGKTWTLSEIREEDDMFGYFEYKGAIYSTYVDYGYDGDEE